MRTIISRWFLFGLLLGWAMTHATVFGQTGKTATDTKTTTVEKVRQGLDKTVTIDFTGQSLADALNHFKDKVGVPINVDPSVLLQMQMPFNPGNPMGANDQQVTIKGTNEKAGNILRRTLNAHRLSYVILEDGLLITSEDQAMMRQMRQRVSVSLEDVPLKKAVRDLAKSHGINLIIDPKVAKDADAPVSLQLDNTGIETTLRLMAELANLKAVRMGNVMFITSEEKAKKIREEEQHQFDNPLNPNINNMVPPPIVGFARGFGGIAMPPVPLPAGVGAGAAPPGVNIAPMPMPPVPVRPVDPAGKALPPMNPPPPVQRPDGTVSSPPAPPPPPPPPTGRN